MRSRIIGFLMLAVLAIPSFAAAEGLGFVRISLLEGDVQVRSEETGEWVPAAPNTPLREGDSIWTPDEARVEIQFRDGTVIRMDQRTSLDILAAEDDGQQFRVDTGRLYVKTGRNEQQFIGLDLPQGALKVYNSARFRLDVPADDHQTLTVFRGVVYVDAPAARTQVKTGEVLTLDGNRAELATDSPRSDEWDRWNIRRDDRLEKRYVSSRYVPSELEPYTADLDENGEWLYERDYGYVWRPRAVVADWSPYSVGRWVWIGGDYVWISQEHWGWAPYHYGRWIYTPYRGWCWVPPARGDVYWSPGYVAWVNTSTYVGWVPLAPGEVYYGRGYYGRHSANITTVNININIEHKHYRNFKGRNAVIVVDRDSFGSGKPRHVKVKENIFISREASYGRPEIKHRGRDAYSPSVRTIAVEKLPPEKIRRRSVQELKERGEKRRDEIRVIREERKRGESPERRFSAERGIERRVKEEQRKEERIERREEKRDDKRDEKRLRREEQDQRREKRVDSPAFREERLGDGERKGGFRRESDVRTQDAAPQGAGEEHGGRGRGFSRQPEAQGDAPEQKGEVKRQKKLEKRERKKEKQEVHEGDKEGKRKDRD